MIKVYEVLVDITDDNGKILKKDVAVKKPFETSDIRPEQYLNSKGNIIKKYCWLHHGDKIYKCNHPFDEIISDISCKVVGGFASKAKYYGKKNNKNKRI